MTDHYPQLSMSEFTGHPKPLANEIEAAQIDRAILRGTDKVLERALRMANALRLAGDATGAKTLHDLAQLLGAVARNDRKPPEEQELRSPSPTRSMSHCAAQPSLLAMLTGAFLSGSPERNRACARLYRAINLGSLPSGFLAGYLVAGSMYRLLLLPLLPATAALIVALGWRQLRGGEWKSEVEALVQEKLPTHAERKTGSLIALGTLLLGAVVFWFGYNQSNNSLALWADKYVDRLVLGFTIPAPWFASLNPLFIILFTPAAEWLDGKAENGRVRVPLPEKLVAGMVLVISSFALLYASGPSPLWLVTSYALLSMGELLVSAAATAAITSWAPRGMTARYLSGWFLSISAGGYLSGVFGTTTDLRSLFGWTAAACAVGCGWFAPNRGRFNRQEELVRAAQVAS